MQEGTVYYSPDPEQPLLTVVGRTHRGVRFLLGDQLWHWREDSLTRAIERSGYRVAST